MSGDIVESLRQAFSCVPPPDPAVRARVRAALAREIARESDRGPSFRRRLHLAGRARELLGAPGLGRRIGLVVGAAALLAGAVVAGALVFTNSSDAGRRFDATEAFAVFSKGSPTDVPPDLTMSPTLNGNMPPGAPRVTPVDFSRARELGRHLGQFDSRLLIFPREDNRSVCYALIAASRSHPASGYCYQPSHPASSAAHYSFSAPQAIVDGKIGVQLYGIAFDDVARLRVQVRGEWREVPLVGENGFFLDLPGVSREDLGHFEATLEDGTVQMHDVQTLTRVR